MAYVESKRMWLQCVTTDEHYARLACFGCEDFKLRFAVEEQGDTIGIDGEHVACLTHAPACDYWYVDCQKWQVVECVPYM
eukprot:COSAG02_NODE_31206_length_537_cov_1.178082_2_plen_80_part_00